jgi:hypothetical protein
LGRHRQQAHRRDETDPTGKAVHAIDEVDGVGDGHDPHHREYYGDSEGEIASELHRDADAGAYQEKGRDQLDQQAEDGGQAVLVVDEPGHDHERPSEEDGEHLHLHVHDDDAAEEGGDDQCQDHRGEDGQPAGVGERFLVDAPGVRFVRPTEAEGIEADARGEPPGGHGRDDEGQDDRHPTQPAWGIDAESL